MKNSFKLLIGLFLVLVVAMFGAAVSLRKQYDSIDKKNPYARWKAVALPAFHAVKLTGPTETVVQIQPGKSARLLIDTLRRGDLPAYTYRVERDTLYMTLSLAEGEIFRSENENEGGNIEPYSVRLVVEVPALIAISTVNANCQITRCEGDTLTLIQTGKGGDVLVDNVKYGQLTASLWGRNQLTIAALKNKITQAAITLRDSAKLYQYKDFERGLILNASPSASVRLTGQAVTQAKQR